MSLLRIGYWRQVGRSECPEPGDDQLPNPRVLVDPAWSPDVKSQVVSYLKAGRVRACCMGYSYCRFHCGAPDNMMGSREFTDDVWVWPEGLSHYVEVHSVRLQAEFIDYIQQPGFELPRHLIETNGYDPDEDETTHTAETLYQDLMSRFKGYA